MISNQSKHAGYTLSEVLFALSLVALVASMGLPLLNSNVGKRKLENMAKEAAVEIQLAYSIYARKNVVSEATKAEDFIFKSNYLRLIPASPPVPGDTGKKIQVEGALANCDNGTPGADGICESNCTDATPCLLLHDGGLIQFERTAVFHTTTMNTPAQNKYAIRFLYDPDGENDVQTATVFYLFYGGRITTEKWAPKATVTTHDTLLPSVAAGFIEDPEYIWDWMAD